MIKKLINKLRNHKQEVKEYLHEAELLIIMFNFWPAVQRKWLKLLKYKKKEIDIIMGLSNLFNEKKSRLISKNKPLNRKEIILLENDVIEQLYKPRVMTLLASDKKTALKIALRALQKEHPESVILDKKRINALEEFMNLEGSSVDFLIFKPREILSYQIELT